MGKLIRIIFLVSLFLLTTGFGVYAIFSGQAANLGNRISSGTLKVQVDTDPATSGIQTNAIFDLSSLVPGEVISKQINILNTGSLPLQYNSQAILSSGDDILFTALQLRVGTTSGGDELYNGSMKLFSGFGTGSRLLNAGASENLYFIAFLPENVDETLQGKTISVNFDFKASQIP